MPLPLKSDVWKYFRRNEDKTASCKVCFKVLKTSGNTSNLKKHLRLHTDSSLQNVLKPQSKRSSVSGSEGSPSKRTSTEDTERTPEMSAPIEKKNAPAAVAAAGPSGSAREYEISLLPSTSGQATGRRITQLSLSETLQRAASFEEGGSQYENLIKNLLYFICVDNRPFHVVEGKGFRRLIKTLAPNIKLPSEDTLKRRLDDIYDTCLQRFTEQINSLADQDVALTCDIWSEMMNTQSFLGVTIHFLQNCEIKSKYLTTQLLNKSHTAQNIVQYLEECCQKFGIKTSNLSAIVTDNGANMVAAVHSFLEPAKHLPCFAHSINRVVEKLMEVENIKLLITKVREIVIFFKNSVKQNDLLKEKQGRNYLKLILDVKTRWNSTFYMLERYLKLKSVVNEILIENPRAPPILNAQENDIIQKIMMILTPFEFVTKDICGEKYITSSKIIPTINCLRVQIREVKAHGDEKNLIEPLKERALKEIQERFGKIEHNHILAVSTLLDPRFKSIHFSDPNACARSISFIRRTVNANDSPCPTAQSSGSEESDTYDFWSVHKKLAHNKRQRFDEGDKDEVGLYLSNQVSSLKSDPLQEWEDMKAAFPRLYNLAKKYLIIPATSVPSERLFSRAGAIMTESRNRLTGSRLDKILFMSDSAEVNWRF